MNMSSSNAVHAAVLHPSEDQRAMLTTALRGFCAEVTSATSWGEIADHMLGLGGVWVLFDQGEVTQEITRRVRDAKQQAFWGILVIGQAPASAQQPLITAGADAYLTYPFDLPTLRGQVEMISESRAPVGSFDVLPQQLASGLDRVWARFDQLSYYDLLELSPIASAE